MTAFKLLNRGSDDDEEPQEDMEDPEATLDALVEEYEGLEDAIMEYNEQEAGSDDEDLGPEGVEQRILGLGEAVRRHLTSTVGSSEAKAGRGRAATTAPKEAGELHRHAVPP